MVFSNGTQENKVALHERRKKSYFWLLLAIITASLRFFIVSHLMTRVRPVAEVSDGVMELTWTGAAAASVAAVVALCLGSEHQ